MQKGKMIVETGSGPVAPLSLFLIIEAQSEKNK